MIDANTWITVESVGLTVFLPLISSQLNYLVPATCCVIILFVFDLPAYTSPTNFPAVLSLFLLYG